MQPTQKAARLISDVVPLIKRTKMKKISIKFNFFSVFIICFLISQVGQNVAIANDKSWQNHFVKNESEIPVNKFRAYYFDERTAGIIRHTEIVDRPAANFVRNDFHGISGDNFGAYWIGYFDFSEPTNMTINVYQSRAESKILINGENITNQDSKKRRNKKSTEYAFSAGRHKIEVQYVSNYFSVSFLVNMLGHTTIHNKPSLRQILNTISNPSVLYCGAYESDNFDMSVNISLKKSSGPLILFLGSYQPIVWKIQDMSNAKLHTVVLSSYGPRSTVENLPKNVLILHYDNLPYVYELISKSSSSSNKRNTFKNLAYTIQDLTGYKPSGFSGKYGLKSVTIPETILDEAQYAQFGMKLHSDKKTPSPSSGSRLDRVFE